jgi:hypothetical protein
MEACRTAPTRMAQMFALEGVLPECLRLVVDPCSHVALLLYLEAGAPVFVLHAVRLTPSAADLLLALLQAYPASCTYRTLFATLYPMDPWDKKLATRPIRRAVLALSRALRHLGLTVIARRRHGYVLACTIDATSMVPLIRLRASQWIAARLVEEKTKQQEENHG